MKDHEALFPIDLRRKNRQVGSQPVTIESVGLGLLARLTVNDKDGKPKYFMSYGSTFREAVLDLHIEFVRWADEELFSETDEGTDDE